MELRKFGFAALLALFSFSFLQAQVRIVSDSTGLRIAATNALPDGGSSEVVTPGLDSATVRLRLFGSLAETYSRISRAQREIYDLQAQATALQGLYVRFDSLSYFARANNMYGSNFPGDWRYSMGGKKSVLTIAYDAQGALTAKDGNKTAQVRILNFDAVEITGGIFRSGNKDVTVAVALQGGNLVCDFNGERIVFVKRKPQQRK